MKLILIFFLLIFSAVGYSQSVQFNFGGQITNYETGKKESGVTVVVMSGGSKVSTAVTASNGKYEIKFDLPAKSVFTIVFSKPGYVSKSVSFDYKNLNTERIKEGDKLTPLDDLSLELFSQKPGVDFSFLDNEPVAKFNTDNGNPTLDISASQRMKQKIESLLDKAGNAVDDTDVKYNAAMLEGEKLYKEEKLEAALKQFEAAAFLKPKEFQPQKRIAEIDKLLRAKKEEKNAVSEVDQQYNNYITAADNFRDAGKYSEALSKYRAAMRVKNEQYPKDEVAKIEKLQNQQAENERAEKEYQAALVAGEAAMSSKQYETAIKQYTIASGLKPDEKLPKDQIAIAKKQVEDLAAAKEKQANYDELMKTAGNLFASSNFEEAKTKYQEALAIFPSEAMLKERIKMCDEQLAKLAQADKTAKEIDALFLEGQAAIDKKEYTAAKGVYKKILGLDPKRNLAQIKLDEIDRLIKADEDAKNAEARFANFVKLGDKAVLDKDFASAKQQYGAALDVKSDKSVQDKFDAVVAKMADKQAKELVASKYEEVMAEAKKLLDENELEKARLKYQNAASIDETQAEPKARIQEIDGRLSKKLEQDKKYREFITKGDALVKEKKYLEAIKSFNSAAEMHPAESEPKEKAEEAARLSKESEADGDRLFENMIRAARENIDAADYTKAKDLASRAISLRPLEKRPEDKRPEEMLKEIDDLQKTEKEYNSYVTAAEKQAEAKEYKKAIESYKKAAEVRPKEETPKVRIKELSELQNNLIGQAEREKKYQDNFKKGVSEMDIKSYKLALESFELAQTFKPDDQVVKDKISEVKQIIEEKEKASADVAERKLLVDKLIKEANLLFEKRDWSQAKSKYEEVVSLDSGQPFSVARIAECDAKLQAEKDKMAESEYRELISNADKNFTEKDFLRSKELFQKANDLKPSDDYPIKKMAEIERLLNPTIVETTSLEPLGDVYTGENSDLDLAKAEIERKNSKTDDFLNAKKKAIEQMEDQSAQMEEKTYKAQTNLNAAEAKADEQAMVADERIQENVEQVKMIQYSASEKMAEEEALNQSKSLANQEKLNYVEEDLQKQRDIADDNVQLKALQMKEKATEISDDQAERTEAYSKSNINKGKQLSQVSIEAQETINDDESRRLMEAQLKIVKESTIAENTALAENQQAKAESNDGQFSELAAANDKMEEDYKVDLESKNEGMRAIEMDNLERANAAYNREMEKHLKVKGQLDSQTKVLERKEAENNENLQIDQAKLNALKSKAALDMRERTQTDKDKEVHVQSTLDYIIITEAERQMEDAKKQNENAEAIKTIQVSAADAEAILVAEKKESSYSAQASLDGVKTSAEESTVESTEKQMKNANAVKDMYVIENLRKEELATQAQEKQRAVTEKLNEVDTKPTVEKAKNTLGMEFPEGVTEEKFSQSGPDGTIHTIITRRIVVVDGHADVFVRTQKNGMSTYKKNNESITEYTWQKETQGSHLVRH